MFQLMSQVAIRDELQRSKGNLSAAQSMKAICFLKKNTVYCSYCQDAMFTAFENEKAKSAEAEPEDEGEDLNHLDPNEGEEEEAVEDDQIQE